MAKRNDVRDNYAQIPNALLDLPISDGAFKLLVYMYSRPKDWDYHNKALCKTLGMNEKTLTKRWKELLDTGIIERERLKVNGMVSGGYDYTIHDIDSNGGIRNHQSAQPPKTGETINNTNLITKTDYTTPSSSNTNYKQLLESWNELAEQLGLKRILKITPDRQKKIQARIKEDSNFLEHLNEAVSMAATIPFLLGKNDRNWKMDLDWLIANSTNYVKILEGKYS